jgi:hypothetical protein
MKQQQIVKTMAACLVTLGAIVLVGTLRTSPPVHAQNQWDDEASLVRIGYKIAPVPLNLAGKDHDLVGLGSFLVNAVGDCNGCHTSGVHQISITPMAVTPTLARRRWSTRSLIWAEGRTSVQPSPLAHSLAGSPRVRNHPPICQRGMEIMLGQT